MLKMMKESRLKPEEAIKKAVAFFGPKGYGLEVKDEGNFCATFEGGGGSVNVSIVASKKGSTIELESFEWDEQVKDFLYKIK